MKPIYKRYFTILSLLWGCTFVTLLVVYICLVEPQKSVLMAINNKVKLRKSEYNRAKAADNKETRFNWNQELNLLDRQLQDFAIDPNNLDELTFDISKIANSVGVEAFASRRISGKVYSPVHGCEYIGYAEIKVEFKGSFNKFARFVNTIERHHPFILINEFRIFRTEKKDLGHRANMVLHVFVKMPSEENAEKG